MPTLVVSTPALSFPILLPSTFDQSGDRAGLLGLIGRRAVQLLTKDPPGPNYYDRCLQLMAGTGSHKNFERQSSLYPEWDSAPGQRPYPGIHCSDGWGEWSNLALYDCFWPRYRNLIVTRAMAPHTPLLTSVGSDTVGHLRRYGTMISIKRNYLHISKREIAMSSGFPSIA